MNLLRTSDTRARLDIPTAECSCGRKYVRITTLQNKCVPCLRAIGPANRKAERAERKATKEKLDDFKKLSHWLELTQKVFNAFIRARDADQPCISCGRDNGSKVNAGHYLSVGSHPELRYDEANVHKQCEYCNTHKSGNAILYRLALLERIGVDELHRLEGPNPPKKYTREQLAELRALYRGKLKELQN